VRTRIIAVRVTVVAVLVTLVALAVPLVLRSDWANTAVHTSAQPPQLGMFSLPEQPRQRWQAASIPPGGAHAQVNPAVQQDTVVVASPHRVEGRDPQTGAVRWSYERRNATVCSWTTQDALVFVAFRKGHGCRDLIALNAGTGARMWYRNAELDADIQLIAMPAVLIAYNSHALVAFDTSGSLNRWSYGRAGCSLSGPVPGDLGIAVLTRCGPEVDLTVVDVYSGHDLFKPVPVGDAPTIMSVGQVVSVLSGGAANPLLSLYSVTGAVIGTLADDRLRYDDPARAGGTVYSGLIIGWTGRAVFAVPISSPKIHWWAPASGPAATGSDDVVAWTADGFADLAVDTGKMTREIGAAHADEPAGLDRIGGLMVASGTTTVTVFG
jgi:hypothetical protein